MDASSACFADMADMADVNLDTIDAFLSPMNLIYETTIEQPSSNWGWLFDSDSSDASPISETYTSCSPVPASSDPFDANAALSFFADAANPFNHCAVASRGPTVSSASDDGHSGHDKPAAARSRQLAFKRSSKSGSSDPSPTRKAKKSSAKSKSKGRHKSSALSSSADYPEALHLRTTAYKPSVVPPPSSFPSSSPPPSSDAIEEATLAHHRHGHNDVEKRYRDRLNAQFKRLLAMLPTEDVSGVDEPRRLTKAHVLDLAQRRLYELECEVGALRAAHETVMYRGAVLAE